MDKNNISQSPRSKPKVYLKYEVQNLNEIYKTEPNDDNYESESPHPESRNNPPNYRQPPQKSADFHGSVFIEPLTPKDRYQYSKCKSPGHPCHYNKNVDVKIEAFLDNLVNLDGDHWKKQEDYARRKYEGDINELSPNRTMPTFKKSDYIPTHVSERIDPSTPKVQIPDFGANPPNDSGPESRKYKKGLANISLKVKNIVLEKEKLTYKQVSDLVLQSSQQDLLKLAQSDRQKEIKNIRRRVYDALNVLVSVGILSKAKDRKHVIRNEWTNFQGKKLTPQWLRIRSQEAEINARRKFCEQKESNLRELKQKYGKIVSLRERNQRREIQEQSADAVNLGQKIRFPYLVIPRISHPQLEIQIQRQEKLETITIRGKNMILISDVDVISKMKFNLPVLAVETPGVNDKKALTSTTKGENEHKPSDKEKRSKPAKESTEPKEPQEPKQTPIATAEKKKTHSNKTKSK